MVEPCFAQAVTAMNAAVFKHNDVAFFRKVADNEDALANLEEAAVPYGGLAALVGRLGVAEMFVQQLFGVPRVREKLAVLDFWLAFHDEATRTQVGSKFVFCIQSPVAVPVAHVCAAPDRIGVQWAVGDASIVRGGLFQVIVRVQEILDCVAAALAELRSSEPLRRQLHLLRYVGNRLNLQGSLDCSALHAPETLAAVQGRMAVALKLNRKLLQVCRLLRATALRFCSCHLMLARMHGQPVWKGR